MFEKENSCRVNEVERVHGHFLHLRHIDLLTFYFSHVDSVQRAMTMRPSLVAYFASFAASEQAKCQKESAEGSLDLQSYVEFKRNYR